jgi:CRP-like cAMP-binding protein
MTPYTPESIPDSLRRLPLFSGIPPEELTPLLPGVREFKVHAHEMLFQKGDNLRGIHVLVSGQAKLFMTTAQGTEKLIMMVKPGQSFGEAVVFLDRPCPVCAEATQDSTVLIVGKDVLLTMMDRNPVFARKMLASISMRLHELMADMETCTLMNSLQRVVSYLSHQMPEDEPQSCEIRLDTSKQMLASRLNLAPETFSRALHHLAEGGVIEVSGRTIRVLDTHRLKTFQG